MQGLPSFCVSFRRIATPLNKKLKKVQQKHLGDLIAKELSAILKIQRKQVFAPILALANAKGSYMLHIDSSSVKVGCVPFEKQPDRKVYLVRYWSRFLTKDEQAYETTQRKYQ